MVTWKAVWLLACLALPGLADPPGGARAVQLRVRLLGLCFRNQAQLDRVEADLRTVEATLAKARELLSRAQAAHQAEPNPKPQTPNPLISNQPLSLILPLV